MSEEDPLAALSAAAKKRIAPSAMPRTSFTAKARRPPAPKRHASYLVPLFIVLGILAIGVPAGILITMKLLQPPPPPPKIHVIIKDGPVRGELFSKVPAQDTTPSKPAAGPDTPPPDPPQ